MDKPFRPAKSCAFKWSGIVLLGSMTALGVSCKKHERTGGVPQVPNVNWNENDSAPSTQPADNKEINSDGKSSEFR